MIALEEKRLKAEEHQMEREAQQRREEQEFQMEMFKNDDDDASRVTPSP